MREYRFIYIIKAMEKVHGKMYDLTRNLPAMVSKMFKPIIGTFMVRYTK